MCPDHGAVLLGLKDQPRVDEQEGLGEGSASCPEPDISLSIPVHPGRPATSPVQAPWASLGSCSCPTALLWD